MNQPPRQVTVPCYLLHLRSELVRGLSGRTAPDAMKERTLHACEKRCCL